MKTRIPFTTNSMIFELKRVMAYKNFFINGQIKFNLVLIKIILEV
jgi:hypothetical protein